MKNQYYFFASSPKLIEDLLANELKTLGAENIKISISGVYFTGSLEIAYRVCLWSRIANHLYLILKDFEYDNKDQIYKEALSIRWTDHFAVENTFAVSCTLTSTNIINHNHYGALIVKDAIADYFRKKNNKRPDIDKNNPDIMVHLHIDKKKAKISINLSGDSLHKRGYRKSGGLATLKENVASAMLLRSDWEKIAASKGIFIDPMCGTATLPIEAAMIAGDIAPGLLRSNFGFSKWEN